jgi:hypothetical protein
MFGPPEPLAGASVQLLDGRALQITAVRPPLSSLSRRPSGQVGVTRSLFIPTIEADFVLSMMPRILAEAGPG